MISSASLMMPSIAGHVTAFGLGAVHLEDLLQTLTWSLVSFEMA